LQFVVFFALVAVAHGGVLQQPIAYTQPIAYAQPALVQKALLPAAPLIKKTDDDYDPNPQYSFSYDIHDGITGDAKSQTESRDGDVVKGQYSLIEADGTRRIVDYSADPIHGFNAVVSKEGVPHAQNVVKVAQPVLAKTLVHSAPVVQKTFVSQPSVTYSQPAVAYHQQQPAYVHKY